MHLHRKSDRGDSAGPSRVGLRGPEFSLPTLEGEAGPARTFVLTVTIPHPSDHTQKAGQRPRSDGLARLMLGSGRAEQFTIRNRPHQTFG